MSVDVRGKGQGSVTLKCEEIEGKSIGRA